MRRYLRDPTARRNGPRPPRATKFDNYRSYLHERIEQARPRWIPAEALLREIGERGYGGGIRLANRALGICTRAPASDPLRST